MKKTKKTTSQTRTLDLYNLRPSATDATLLPVPAAMCVCNTNYRILTTAGNMLIVSDGKDLLWLPTLPTQPAVAELICSLPSSPLCAISHGTALTVMTADGPFRLRRSAADGRFMPVGLMRDWPQITLTAGRGTVHAEYAGGCDIARLGSAVTATYNGVVAAALAAGEYVQPILAAVQLLDREGAVLFRTPPVLLGVDAAKLHEPMKFVATDADMRSVGQTLMQTSGYRVQLSYEPVADAMLAAEVSAMQVLVTPQFHPVDARRDAIVSYGRSPGMGYDDVTVRMRASSLALSGGGAGATTTLAHALASFDRLARVAATIPNPYGNGGAENIRVDAVTALSATAETAAVEAAVTHAASTDITDTVIAPHTFSADAVAANGDAVVWANARAIAAQPYSPAMFAATADARRWHGAARVRMADGTCIVHRFGGSHLPLTLGPLLTYPSPQAVEIALSVCDDETPGAVSHAVTVPLRPAGRMAMGVHPELRHFVLDTPGEILDSYTPKTHAADNSSAMVVLAHGNSPATATLARQVSQHTVAVKPLASPGGGWLFGRSRFVLLTADGVDILTTANSATTATLTMLNNCPAASADVVACSGHCVYVLNEGNIYRINHNGYSPVATGIKGDTLGYDIDKAQLIVGDRDDNRALHIGDDGSRYSTSLTLNGPLTTTPAGVFACTDNGIVCVTRRNSQSTEAVPISLHIVTSFDGKRRDIPRYISLNLHAHAADLRVRVVRRFADGHADTPLASVRVRGAVRSPLQLPMPTVAYRPWQLLVTVDGTVDPQAVFL